MQPPRPEEIRRLLRWRPPHGVVSLYLALDPGDRGEAWRVELRNGLAAATEGARGSVDRESERALEASAARVTEHLSEQGPIEGRALIGFVEVASKRGRAVWHSSQMPVRATRVLYNRRPFVHPLIALLDDGASRGVAALASEQVRLLHWSLGRIEELHAWDLELLSLDWRERKAPRVRDPARRQGVSAAGRDQFGQRLDANRDRFLQEAGKLSSRELRERAWRELLAFGAEDEVHAFEKGLGRPGVHHAGSANLISAEPQQIERRIEGMLDDLNRSRELGIVQRVKDEAYAGGNGALGIQETAQALAQGRVDHLLYDAERDYGELPGELGLALDGGAESQAEGLPLVERLVERALETDASITPLEGESAAALREGEGIGALLRY